LKLFFRNGGNIAPASATAEETEVIVLIFMASNWIIFWNRNVLYSSFVCKKVKDRDPCIGSVPIGCVQMQVEMFLRIQVEMLILGGWLRQAYSSIIDQLRLTLE
jgi:hypothetical protein